MPTQGSDHMIPNRDCLRYSSRPVQQRRWDWWSLQLQSQLHHQEHQSTWMIERMAGKSKMHIGDIVSKHRRKCKETDWIGKYHQQIIQTHRSKQASTKPSKLLISNYTPECDYNGDGMHVGFLFLLGPTLVSAQCVTSSFPCNCSDTWTLPSWNTNGWYQSFTCADVPGGAWITATATVMNKVGGGVLGMTYQYDMMNCLASFTQNTPFTNLQPVEMPLALPSSFTCNITITLYNPFQQFNNFNSQWETMNIKLVVSSTD